MSVQIVTDADFKQEVLQADLPVLVDFWAEWCGPCRMIAPILEEIAQGMAEKIKFVKLNVDHNANTAARFGIRSLPTLIIWKNGKVAAQAAGVRPKSEMMKWIHQTLESHSEPLK